MDQGKLVRRSVHMPALEFRSPQSNRNLDINVYINDGNIKTKTYDFPLIISLCYPNMLIESRDS